jgi:hypothetical protein
MSAKEQTSDLLRLMEENTNQRLIKLTAKFKMLSLIVDVHIQIDRLTKQDGE